MPPPTITTFSRAFAIRHHGSRAYQRRQPHLLIGSYSPSCKNQIGSCAENARAGCCIARPSGCCTVAMTNTRAKPRRSWGGRQMRDACRRGFVAKFVLGFAWLAAVTGFAAPAKAQGYPDRPVKIIVPFPAGGTADAVPRLVAERLSRKWGQPVVIENRTGAAGNIGAEAVYRSDPDGYTLLSAPPPPLVINQNLCPQLGFDPTKFEPIIVMAQVPNALLVNPNNIKASSLNELIDYLQK